MSDAKRLTQLEFLPADFPVAHALAAHLGYTQTPYTSSSDLIGVFCLADRPGQPTGCIIKTRELGFLFVQDLSDVGLSDVLSDQSL